MRVIWLATAADDRRRIFDFLLERNPQAALEVEAELLAAAAGLDRFPLRGRAGLVEGTRELVVVRPYILIYEVDEEQQLVRILRVWHGARNRTR